MNRIYYFVKIASFILAIGVTFSSCVSDKGTPNYNNYPTDIGKLFFTKCATTGCHNDASKNAAAGLSMQSWDNLFEGGKGSACVIPYRPDFSTLLYYVNTYSDLGPTLGPVMPYNKERFSREDVLLIKKWIAAGAPDIKGFVKFSDNPNRKKFYVANQGCDVVTVFDQETLLPMRYVDVGNSPTPESPYNIKVSADGQYWYSICIKGNSLQKFRTSDDSFVGEAMIGFNFWTNVTISNDGLKAFVSGWSSSGEIAEVDLNTLTVTHHTGLNYPRGSYLNTAGDTLYVAQQTSSNKIYKIPTNNFAGKTQINLYTTPPASGVISPSEILFSKDGSKYFVSCQGTSELRIFQHSNDSLLAIIPVGALPTAMDISSTHNYLFVACQEDTSSVAGLRGTVAIIDIATNLLITKIYTGHQPHGIAVDDNNDLVYVANRNSSSGGPAPHHSVNISTCSGNNGYVTFIDMKTLSLIQQGSSSKQVEIAVDPYSIAIRP
jgi:DNA-binding beta-propeller fold protein YncE